ncbi:MAG: sulfotransferase domain-containing protein [Fimbriimonadaceae bacterium]|nr:sulfotransferase domain-containing protein [Chitinophagales bacterium]
MEHISNHQIIYFHVGMGKVASKYLQHEVFPKLKDVYYIPSTKYYQSIDIIKNKNESAYLISREFDQQMEYEVNKFAQTFPNTKAIILLRRHDSWIASQYRRFAKNGYVRSFKEFIDIENDAGRFKLQDLNFYRNIEILEKYFTEKPLVLFYDDLIADTFSFIDKIAKFTNTTYRRAEISLEKKHTSYEEKQIKVMQSVSKYISFKERTLSTQPVVRFLQRLPIITLRYGILYTALLIPSAWLGKKSLIPKEELEKIKIQTEEDWKKCLSYAEKNNH